MGRSKAVGGRASHGRAAQGRDPSWTWESAGARPLLKLELGLWLEPELVPELGPELELGVEDAGGGSPQKKRRCPW